MFSSWRHVLTGYGGSGTLEHRYRRYRRAEVVAQRLNPSPIRSARPTRQRALIAAARDECLEMTAMNFGDVGPRRMYIQSAQQSRRARCGMTFDDGSPSVRRKVGNRHHWICERDRTWRCKKYMLAHRGAELRECVEHWGLQGVSSAN